MNTLSSKSVVEPLGSLGSTTEKNKQWQRELLMERIRTHSNQHKTFQELSKAMRMSMLEKRYALDAVEKSNLQKCLDSMQHCIKVTTRQGLVERLESLSRQLGLKFMEDTSGLFISSDMFYLEIIIDQGGTLSDVKVHHECKIEQQSCSELVTCLLNSDFNDFTVQLEGLSSIYQLNAEPKVKSKAFIALQAMETDLYNLFTIQNFHKDTQMMITESSVGIVQKRRGGHPMKLTYFVPPYDLLNLESKAMLPLSIDLISTKNIGMSVTVNLEASPANKLQILPTVSFNQDPHGASVPIYSPMTATNSTLLPATFVLRFNKPLPVCDSLKENFIHSPESSSLWDTKASTSIMQLIVQTASEGEIQHSSKGLFVSLPDQNHCYFFTENKNMKGTTVISVPFTEPSQVPKILSALKRQSLFHTLLASCVRPLSKTFDLESTVMLEVNAISIYQISVALQHPFEESMATIEFDLNDPTNVMCRVYSLTNNYDLISVKLSKIAQISLSIPVTVRALLIYWDQERLKNFHRGIENGNFNLPLGPGDPGGRGNDMRDMKVKTERNMNGNFNNSSRQFFHPSGVMMSSTDGFSSDGNVSIFGEASNNDSTMMNQFTMKSSNNELNFSDVGAIKGYPTGEDFCKSPKSNVDLNCPQFSENSDSSSLGTSTQSSDSGVATHNIFQKGLRGEHESYSSSSNSIECGKGLKANEIKSRDDSDRMNKAEDFSTRENQLHSNISITAVSKAEMKSVLSEMGLDKRPGIEIIPISAATAQSMPSTITITPLNSSSSTKSLKKSSSNKKYDDKARSEKKRKRKKEDFSMGPPEKMFTKQDGGISRQLGSSGKMTDSSVSSKYSHSTSPKLSPSFSASGGGSINSSNSSTKPSPKNSPAYSSPKYLSSSTSSPKDHYGITSPKHGSSTSSGKPSMSALKSVTNSLSPKNERSKGSYKEKDRDRERERNSKFPSSGGSPKIKSSSVKLKQIDLRAAFLPAHEQNYYEDAQTHPQNLTTSSTNSNSSGSSGQLKARKSSLNAVIDKLKSAQTTGDEFIPGSQSLSTQKLNDSDGSLNRGEKSGSNSSGNRTQSLSSSNFRPSLTNPNSNLNSEYMIKPSLDGMKITINKTRTKDAPSSMTYKASSPSGINLKITSPSGSGSPKKNTGLKPGVSSGPASKKCSSQLQHSGKSSSPSLLSTSQSKGTFQKSHSSGSLSSKSSVLAKNLSSNSFSDAFRRDKSNKLKTTPIGERPVNSRPDPTDVMKILRFASPNNAMEGFMKSLNTKFQIPKLSARSGDSDSKKDTNTNRINSASAPNTPVGLSATSPPVTNAASASVNNCTSMESSGKGLIEIPPKNMTSKYPFSMAQQTTPPHPPNNAISKIPYSSHPSPVYGKDLAPLPKSSSSDTILSLSSKEHTAKPFSSTPSTPIHMGFSPFASPVANAHMNSSPIPRVSPSESPGLQSQPYELTMRPPSAPCAVDMTKNSELDLSMKSDSRNSDHRPSASNSSIRKVPSSTQKMSFPSSPSVSLHFVKSPVPSPLVMPSPHSNSPCITDDELMDEALIGIGGK